MKFLQKNTLYTYLYSSLYLVIPFTEHLQAVPNILLGVLGFFFLFNFKRLKINCDKQNE